MDDVNDNSPVFKSIEVNRENDEVVYDDTQDFVEFGNATIRIKKVCIKY